MDKLFALSLPTKLILVGCLVLILSVGAWRIHHNIWQNGYDKRVAEQNEAKIKQDQENQKNVTKTEKNYEKIKKEIISQKNSNVPVGPITSLAIDRMP